MSCYTCKHYHPWGGLDELILHHYCTKDSDIGEKCEPNNSEDCIDYDNRGND